MTRRVLYPLFFAGAILLFGGPSAGSHNGEVTGPRTTIGVRGAFTVPPYSNNSALSWEAWWARNRFTYLSFPPTQKQLESVYPVTPRSDGAEQLDTMVQFLKAQAGRRFIPFMEHSAIQVRSAAVMALALLKDEEALPRTVELLRDSNQLVRDAALMALALHDHGKARHLLFHLARSTPTALEATGLNVLPDYYRGFALIALSINGARGTVPILHDLARNPKQPEGVRAMALEGLGLLGGEEAANFLIAFSSDRKTDPRLTGVALAALGRTREDTVLPVLLKHLASRKAELRRSAALGMGLHSEKEDLAMVERLNRVWRQSADDPLKGFTLLSMGAIGGPVAVKRLARASRVGQNTICPFACLGLGLALGKHHDREGEKVLIQILGGHKKSSFQGAAAIALGLAGNPSAIEPLRKTLEEGKDPYLKCYAALALGMLKEPEATRECLRKVALAKGNLPLLRAHATLALALIGDHDSASKLFETIWDSSLPGWQADLSMALGFFGDLHLARRTLEGWDQLDGPKDDMTRACLMLLVARLVSGRAVPYLTPYAACSNFAGEYPLSGTILSMGM